MNLGKGIMLQIFIIILFQISSKTVSLCSSLCSKSTDYSHYFQLYWRILQLFLLCNQKLQQYFIAYVYYWVKLKQPITIAVIVVKCSVTNVWGYELLHASPSIRVSDCSITVSRSRKSFLCQLCPKNASNFTPSLFLKSFQHNSHIPSHDTIPIRSTVDFVNKLINYMVDWVIRTSYYSIAMLNSKNLGELHGKQPITLQHAASPS